MLLVLMKVEFDRTWPIGRLRIAALIGTVPCELEGYELHTLYVQEMVPPGAYTIKVTQ